MKFMLQVRQALTKQREAKMKAMRDAQPKQPVEISVIAGDGKPVKIQLGGDTQEDSRKQVAEAAGLKHVPLPDFDDNNAAWAGSLKKTPRGKAVSGRGGELVNALVFYQYLPIYFYQRRNWTVRIPGQDPCVMLRDLARTRSMRRKRIHTVELHGWELSDMLFMTTR